MKLRSSASPFPRGLEERASDQRLGKPPKSIVTLVKLLVSISNSRRFEALDIDTGRGPEKKL
jgi:hypothetical protein